MRGLFLYMYEKKKPANMRVGRRGYQGRGAMAPMHWMIPCMMP